jgi:7-carboxy-7-deazaguanine synthase
MAAYKVKEIYYTLQGEGYHTGRPAVFCRFTGCNLWSGREEDRHKAICQFCDTDFWGTDGINGGSYPDAAALARQVKSLWPEVSGGKPMVVCTGGEPMLQLNEALIDAFHGEGLKVAIETNGTIPVPRSIEWICVSPKAGAELVQLEGDELKLVYPQSGAMPGQYEQLDFKHFFLQPMDGSQIAENTRASIEYCKQHPRWRLSIQTHKILQIP